MHEYSKENPPLRARNPRSYLYLGLLVALSLGILFMDVGGKGPVTDYSKKTVTPGMVSAAQPTLPTEKMELLRVDGKALPFTVEIATTEQQKEKGLMFRNDMQPDQGMLFLYDKEEPRRMWMKDTPLALDMLFLSQDGTILDIVPNTVPFSEEIIAPASPARAILELRGGVAAAYGIEKGGKLQGAAFGNAPNPARSK